jgi:FKBP-type peptidyl-prolyl cis-trans isomerase 2
MMIKIGESDILKGVELSLIGCHEGDVVEAYLTLDAAYGNKVVGMVGKESAVAWFYVIESVVKP